MYHKTELTGSVFSLPLMHIVCAKLESNLSIWYNTKLNMYAYVCGFLSCWKDSRRISDEVA